MSMTTVLFALEWIAPQRDRLATAGVQLIELAGGAYAAFVSQGSEERCNPAAGCFDSTWKHNRLALEVHAPFDLTLKEASKAREADARDLVNGIKRPAFENWRDIVDAFRTLLPAPSADLRSALEAPEP